MPLAATYSIRTRHRRDVGLRLASLWTVSRRSADTAERLSLELEQAEHLVQPNNPRILLALLGSELALGALLRQLLDARRQVVADGIEGCLELLQGPLLHERSAIAWHLWCFPTTSEV